jgi:hypothetical protein
MAKLTIEDGGRQTVYEILDESIVLGIREGVAVRLSDAAASPEHCQIRLVPGTGYKLIDLESKNGTKVNGSFVNQKLLEEGDVIQIGGARIVYSAAGGLPAAAAPAAPATPFARSPHAARPAAAPPPRTVPSRTVPSRTGPAREPREGREGRPRYARRKSSNAPVIVLGVVVGMLLFMVAAIVFAGSWFRQTPNQKLYFDSMDAQKDGDYQRAYDMLEAADPAENSKWYEKIRARKAELAGQLEAGHDREISAQAFKEYSALESWCQDHRSDVEGQVARLRDFMAKYPETRSALDARQRLQTLLGPGASERVAGTGDVKKDLEERWQIAYQSAELLVAKDRFGEAIDAIWKFFGADTKAALAEAGLDLGAWEKKVEGRVREINTAAGVRFAELDKLAQGYVEDGRAGDANRIYRDIALKFGIDKYVRLAQQRKSEVGKED